MRIQRRGEVSYDWQLYGGAGRLAVESYFRDQTTLPANVMLYHLPPGSSEGEHIHLEGEEDSCTPYSSDELYAVVSGRVVVTADGERAELGPGDAAYTPAGSRHGVANETDEPAELVIVFGPPKG